jgi:hypothetical protein
MVIGSSSDLARCPSSGAPAGFRIVAYTLWPALAKATAVANPMPELVPVMRTRAIMHLLCSDRIKGSDMADSGDVFHEVWQGLQADLERKVLGTNSFRWTFPQAA